MRTETECEAAWSAMLPPDDAGESCDQCEDGHVLVFCGDCGGSGEGPADGTICPVCKSWGDVRRECDNLCEYCGAHTKLNTEGLCRACAAG